MVQAGTESSAFRFVHPHNTAQHNTHNTAQVSVGSQMSPFGTGWCLVHYLQVCSSTQHNTTHTTQHNATCTMQHRSVWEVAQNKSVCGVRCHLLIQAGTESSTFRFVQSHSSTQHNTAQHCTTQHRSVCGVRCPLLVQAGTESSTFRFVHSRSTAQHCIPQYSTPSTQHSMIQCNVSHDVTQHSIIQRSVGGIRCHLFGIG